MGEGDLGKLQREAGGGGKRAPAPPGYWEPAQGPATPAGLGLGASAQQEGFATLPPLGQSRAFTGILGDKIIRDCFFTVLRGGTR